MVPDINLELINSDEGLKKLYREYLKAKIEADTLNIKMQTLSMKAAMIEDKKAKKELDIEAF